MSGETVVWCMIAAEFLIFVGTAYYSFFINPPHEEDADVTNVLDDLE